MTGPTSYREACVRAKDAHSQLRASAQAARARIAPARLKQDVATRLAGSAMDGAAFAAAKVQQRPVAFGAAGAAFLLFLARRPLMALFGRLYVRIRNPTPDTLENDDG